MDKPREKKGNRRRWLLLPLISLICVLVYSGYQLINKRYSGFNVDRDSLIIGEVEYGQFSVSVRGPGVLLPLHERWVASRVDGRIDSLNIKPGTQVSKGDTLLVLNNPLLIQLVEELGWELKAMQAQKLADKVAFESQLLDQQAIILAAKMRYDKSVLKLDAETILVERGNSTVSRIDHARSKLDASQQKQVWQIEKLRLDKMQENLKAQINAANANYQRLHKKLKRAQHNVDELTVKASIDGVVQKVPVKLGQRISIGSNLALIGQQDKLYAQIDIAETQIRQINIGQIVIVDTRNNIIRGEVNRIAPSVNDGTVKVDVTLSEPLPDDARPDLSIDASIAISQIDQTLFMRRPAFAQSNQMNSIYKLSDDGQSAIRHDVYFGKGSLSQIQIKEGLSPGDKVILSDSTPWQSYSDIKIY